MSKSNDNALRTIRASRIDGTQRTDFDDQVITETAIAMVYNGSAHAVMMATPVDLEDFALGFSLSEGIVASPSEWRLLEVRKEARGIGIEMHIPQARFDALRTRQRHIIGNSACGLCGSESLQAAMRPLASLHANDAVFRVDRIREALHQMAAAQPLNQASGGVHAAGFAHAEGLLVREDVGRHNALDKIIGARARAALDAGFAVISSRASYELVHKTANAGIPLLATLSAPTSAAIELAEHCALTLIAFARGERMNLYTHHERLI